MKRRLDLWIVMIVLIMTSSWFFAPLIPSLSNNPALLKSFDTDEDLHVQIVKTALEEGKVEFFNYPHLYINVNILVLKVIGTNDPSSILIVARLISLVFGILCALMGFIILRRFIGPWLSGLGALLIMFSSRVYIGYSVNAHPDTLQLFFILLCLFSLIRLLEKDERKWLLLAGISSALVFSAKYTGVFLLPCILFVGGINIFRKNSRELKAKEALGLGGLLLLVAILIDPLYIAGAAREEFRAEFNLIKLAEWARILILVPTIILLLPSKHRFAKWHELLQKLIFIGGTPFVLLIVIFILTSPDAAFEFRFLDGLLYESQHVTFGHWFKDEVVGLGWMEIFSQQHYLGVSFLMIAMISPILLTGLNQVKHTSNIVIVCFIWILVYFGYLAFRIRAAEVHYLLPIFPAVILLLMVWLEVAQVLLYRLIGDRMKYTAIASVVLVFILFSSFQFPQMLELRTEMIHRPLKSDKVLLSKWLNEYVDKDAVILADQYTYVPDHFEFTHIVWGGTFVWLESLEPHYIITNQYLLDKFTPSQTAEDFILGKDNYLEKLEYYEFVRGLNPIKEFGAYKVYDRRNEKDLGIRAYKMDTSFCVGTFRQQNKSSLVECKDIEKLSVSLLGSTGKGNEFALSLSEPLIEFDIEEGDTVLIRSQFSSIERDKLARFAVSIDNTEHKPYFYKSKYLSTTHVEDAAWPREIEISFVAPVIKRQQDLLKIYYWTPAGIRIQVEALQIQISKK